MPSMGHNFDLTKVRTVIYHLPDGKHFAIEMDALVQFMELGFGQVCDTSEINGVIHFFPKGNA